MYKLSSHVHFVGVGGVGMAGIAEILCNLGYSVSGSDIRDNRLINHLQRLGVKVVIGHNSSNIPEETSFVVVSSAIQAENPELIEARRRKIPTVSRGEMLAELMRMKYGIAIAGSHGKTTTTSLVAKVLSDGELDPTVIVGGRVLSSASGASLGEGKYLVAESDESDGSFSLLRPAIAVVTNIDAEHLGHYGSFGALEDAFKNFMASVPFYGLVVAYGDHPIVAKLIKGVERRVLTYGTSSGCDVSAQAIEIVEGGSRYELWLNSKYECEVYLPLPGVHMVLNSLAAISVGIELGLSISSCVEAISSFAGVARRSEVLLNQGRQVVIDDYGHHPTEIKATLEAVKGSWVNEKRRSKGGKLIVFFQPHRYSRTKDLFGEFVSCFNAADKVIVCDIYPGGEEPIEGISAEKLAASLQHPDVKYIGNPADCLLEIKSSLGESDVLVALGAGDVSSYAHQLAESYLQEENVLKKSA